MSRSYLFTSESVSEGHPDKVCDRISDMVVDTYLKAEPQSRVGCETLTTTNKVVLAGEVRGPEIKKDDLIQKVRECIKDIGYDQEGFTWKDATKIESHLHSQSVDIAMDVTNAFESWVSGSLNNEGFILKHDSSLENDTVDYGQLKFFSKETNTIYQPKVRIGWDESNFETG